MLYFIAFWLQEISSNVPHVIHLVELSNYLILERIRKNIFQEMQQKDKGQSPVFITGFDTVYKTFFSFYAKQD